MAAEVGFWLTVDLPDLHPYAFDTREEMEQAAIDAATRLVFETWDHDKLKDKLDISHVHVWREVTDVHTEAL